MEPITPPPAVAALCRSLAGAEHHEILESIEIAKELQGALSSWVSELESRTADIREAKADLSQRRPHIRNRPGDR